MTDTVNTDVPVAGRLSTLDRFLPVWIGVAIATMSGTCTASRSVSEW